MQRTKNKITLTNLKVPPGRPAIGATGVGIGGGGASSCWNKIMWLVMWHQRDVITR